MSVVRETVFCVQEDLTERRLVVDDLVIPVTVIARAAVASLLSDYDTILDF
ncbi:MAG: hypothetical protein AAF525_19645 [Pseudomonadota bacterium]